MGICCAKHSSLVQPLGKLIVLNLFLLKVSVMRRSNFCLMFIKFSKIFSKIINVACSSVVLME